MTNRTVTALRAVQTTAALSVGALAVVGSWGALAERIDVTADSVPPGMVVEDEDRASLLANGWTQAGDRAFYKDLNNNRRIEQLAEIRVVRDPGPPPDGDQ